MAVTPVAVVGGVYRAAEISSRSQLQLDRRRKRPLGVVRLSAGVVEGMVALRVEPAL